MVEGNLEPRKEDSGLFMTILCLLSNSYLTKVSAKIKLKGVMWTVYVVWEGTDF